MLGARRIAAARVFGTLITATRDGPRNYRHPSKAGLRTTAPAPALIPLPENCRIVVAWSFIEAGGSGRFGMGLSKKQRSTAFLLAVPGCYLTTALSPKPGFSAGNAASLTVLGRDYQRKQPARPVGRISSLARGNVQFRLDSRRASFEASLREAPQDEENFLMPSRTSLMLRRRAAPSRSAPGVDATSN
jgi:hypothetical protein